MQYAIVDGRKIEPQKGAKGICFCCGKDVVAKCGKVKVHHWAHKNLKDCDTWWERETEWHREWKNKFPEEFREIKFVDERTNEIHRADIHTPEGITIEFQNSPISIDEVKSRDEFYDKLLWVVNGANFDFEFTCNLPNPESPLLDNFEFMMSDKHLGFIRKAEIKNNEDMCEYLNINHTELKYVKEEYTNAEPLYWNFVWKRKHYVWYNSTSHVFLDLGHDFLYWLKSRTQTRTTFWYIQVVKKKDFIKKYSLIHGSIH